MSKIIKTSCALGFFDGLHLGHIEVIRAAVIFADKQGLKPAVFTFSSGESNTKLPKMRGGGNIISAEQKLSMLKDMGAEIVYSPDFSEIKDLTTEEFVSEVLEKKLSAAAVSCGYDFHFGKGGLGDADILKKLCGEKGIIVNIVPAVNVNGVIASSSKIRSLISGGNISAANKLLGYSLCYILPVLHGKKLGRKMGVPTANQMIPAGNVTPRYGVYKSRAVISGKDYPAITNIGLRPTVSGSKLPLMETHIIGYKSEDFYGENIKVSLIDFIREERKFGGVEELAEQIKKDINTNLI